ncbi:DUF262 domain-containing HNH endonuclease family protein [Hymenobacter sp. ASUV-10]|uniref:DUF262 domain-containing HNH endonuclease family protein n=1 Tax=Hymenobacter aranciens TaxID=3063996 RepID=A0ABT9BC66_9BACT|nr:DUF262 domain-containing HNH endonuclease family protein [Hymenobacter sp. ASUV-10]MDO7874301.1 DUF262 domain-containing HNH endonuclease family protein [Hymenobacter sp. ASUV-10]
MAGIKIRDFFNGRFFEIPKYQRGYAWEKNNVRDLFNDVTEAVETNSNHYIGTIVLSRDDDDDEKFHVVDGQQRITTITLMMAELVKHLEERDSHFYERIYISESDRHRLLPLSRDQKYFVDLLGGTVGEPQNKSQRFLSGAFEEIEAKVAAIPDKLKFLKSIEKLEIMEFVENSEGDAIRIFQTVNDRGKPLSNIEKAKSLLIYFSNRYLGKRLDNSINDIFSDIFEIYDDIKHIGESLNITLIANKDFNEDNIMRYHFVSFSDEDYDPSASQVLNFLKRRLTKMRSDAGDGDFSEMEAFIKEYASSLHDFFFACRQVVQKAETNEKYYRLFVILNLSATLYPLVTKMEALGLIDKPLPKRSHYTFFDLIELIDVRVYKTRGTDPKSHIANFTHSLANRNEGDVENWLIWFNGHWMPKELFQSYLWGNIYGNRALNHIFLTYSEHLSGKLNNVDQLKAFVGRVPTIEHVLSQTPKFAPKGLGFKNTEDFLSFEDSLGNLTPLEKSLNSAARNKGATDKIEFYNRSKYKMTRLLGSAIDTANGFNKKQIEDRTTEVGTYCLERWWC